MLTPLIICYILICLLNIIYDNAKLVWLIFIAYLLIPTNYSDPISYIVNEYILQIISFMIMALILVGYKEYTRAYLFGFVTVISCIYLHLFLFVTPYTIMVYWIQDYVYYELLLVLALSLKEGINILYYALVIILLIIGHTI